MKIIKTIVAISIFMGFIYCKSIGQNIKYERYVTNSLYRFESKDSILVKGMRLGEHEVSFDWTKMIFNCKTHRISVVGCVKSDLADLTILVGSGNQDTIKIKKILIKINVFENRKFRFNYKFHENENVFLIPNIGYSVFYIDKSKFNCL